MSFNPLISLARNAERQKMEMQCDPQWVLNLAAERDQLRAEVETLKAAVEFNRAPDEAKFGPGHPVFELCAENDRLRAEVAMLRSYEAEWERTLNQLRAELEAIRGQQPVAWVSPDAVGGTRWKAGALQQLNDGSPLYALPPQLPDAVSVPRELLERIGKLFPADMEDDGSGRAGFYPHVREAVQELRALLATEPE